MLTTSETAMGRAQQEIRNQAEPGGTEDSRKQKFGHSDQDRHLADVSWVRRYQHCVGHFRRTTDRADTAFPMSRAKVSFGSGSLPATLRF